VFGALDQVAAFVVAVVDAGVVLQEVVQQLGDGPVARPFLLAEELEGVRLGSSGLDVACRVEGENLFARPAVNS